MQYKVERVGLLFQEEVSNPSLQRSNPIVTLPYYVLLVLDGPGKAHHCEEIEAKAGA